MGEVAAAPGDEVSQATSRDSVQTTVGDVVTAGADQWLYNRLGLNAGGRILVARSRRAAIVLDRVLAFPEGLLCEVAAITAPDEPKPDWHGAITAGPPGLAISLRGPEGLTAPAESVWEHDIAQRLLDAGGADRVYQLRLSRWPRPISGILQVSAAWFEMDVFPCHRRDEPPQPGGDRDCQCSMGHAVALGALDLHAHAAFRAVWKVSRFRRLSARFTRATLVAMSRCNMGCESSSVAMALALKWQCL
jgi:hypothetical protein